MILSPLKPQNLEILMALVEEAGLDLKYMARHWGTIECLDWEKSIDYD
jgi:hypothetical protein